jgi:hypothetical protein
MKTITRVLAVLAISGWASSASAIPITDYVTVGSNQWAQPDDFTSLSWNDIFSVCGTGTCSGTLTSGSGTYNMNGWAWADIDAVNDLFNTYIASAGGTATPLSGPSMTQEVDAAWAPAVFVDFTSTTGPNHIAALMSDQVSPIYGSRMGMWDNQCPGCFDGVDTDRDIGKNDSSTNIGAWFIRDTPSGVPVPGTLFLVGLGLLGLRISRQRAI